MTEIRIREATRSTDKKRLWLIERVYSGGLTAPICWRGSREEAEDEARWQRVMHRVRGTLVRDGPTWPPQYVRDSFRRT